jgi:DNA repair protein NreA
MSDIKFEVVKKIAETNFKFRDFGEISRLDSNSPPSVFVGSKLKYPLVNVGILSPLDRDENAWVYDDAKYWAEQDFQIQDVIKLRNSLLNSRFQSRVQDSRLNKKFVHIAQEIAIASKPVDVEIELKNRLRFDKSKDKILAPHGMRAGLKEARITSNLKVHRKLDKVMNDELKASEGIELLYKYDFDEYTLSKILSVGVLGLKKNKKLVPTRWSITATDDTIGKKLIEKIKDYKWIENYELFFGEYLGNQYVVLLFPNVWSYELFEIYLPKSSWNPSENVKASTDYEDYSGRKTYAFATAGGYYATRLPVLKYLDEIKKQASVLVVRIETPSYWASLGVWVVRESVRKALKNKMKFDSREDLLESAKKISKIKYGFDNSDILRRSRLVRDIKVQKKLGEFF